MRILEERIPEISESWLDAVRADPMLAEITMSDEARTDHVPRVLDLAIRLADGEKLSDVDTNAARDHGIVRERQGYTVPLMLRETRFLDETIAKCMQDNLLSIEFSHLIPDMITVNQTIAGTLATAALLLAAPEVGVRPAVPDGDGDFG